MTHPLIIEAERIGKERRRRAEAYKGPPLPFTHLGHDREADMPWLTHEEAAGMVRMLLRNDLDHESVCCMARDRILHLAQENERLKAELSALSRPMSSPAEKIEGDQS
jgi:hypothetical protein